MDVTFTKRCQSYDIDVDIIPIDNCDFIDPNTNPNISRSCIEPEIDKNISRNNPADIPEDIIEYDSSINNFKDVLLSSRKESQFPITSDNNHVNSNTYNSKISLQTINNPSLINQYKLNQYKLNHCKSYNNNINFNRRRLVLDTPFSTRSTISYGLIVYAKDTKRWAIIQRKHSVEFLLFIRGLYRLTYLPLLLSCITKTESDIIEKCLKEGPNFFKSIYLKDLELCPDGLEYALIRMAESRNVVLTLLSKLDLSKNNLKWTWPKGRLHISSDRETPFDCAKREFTEEVEIILPPPLFISDTYVSENVKTITGRNIESRYWIYIISNEIPMKPPQSHPEVADRNWVDTETCQSLLSNVNNRQNDLFKQIITMISSIDD
jgi:ADP-ribose pyrophosphatase YjhB (NUDIX family)